MSSSRGQRMLAREGKDSLGDEHYPGTGAAAKGEVINPALQPGAQTGYVYDWARTWPSGSNPEVEPALPAVLEPGGVSGPHDSPRGIAFWISRSGGQGLRWYYWIDTDSQPGPDTRRQLADFLADDGIDYGYRDDVMQRAASLGWTP